MTSFIVVFIIIWVVSVGAWWLTDRYVRKSDMGKVRARLLGTPVKKPKTQAQTKQLSLIQREDLITGRLVLQLLERFQLSDRIQILLEQAGSKWTVARFSHSCMACFLAAFAVAWMWLPVEKRYLAFIPAGIASVFPVLFVYQMRSRRLTRFEALFPDSLEFISRSMRAGHAFSVSLEMIHREFDEPLASEFRRTFEESNLGMPLELAMQKLGQRVPSLDVHFFVSAVLLQKRTGGNLAEILDKLAFIMRERFKLRGRIKAISAHGRMTGISLSVIPLAVGALLFMSNPEFMRFFLNEELGNQLLGGIAGLQLLGYFIMQKIVKIEV